VKKTTSAFIHQHAEQNLDGEGGEEGHSKIRCVGGGGLIASVGTAGLQQE